MSIGVVSFVFYYICKSYMIHRKQSRFFKSSTYARKGTANSQTIVVSLAILGFHSSMDRTTVS